AVTAEHGLRELEAGQLVVDDQDVFVPPARIFRIAHMLQYRPGHSHSKMFRSFPCAKPHSSTLRLLPRITLVNRLILNWVNGLTLNCALSHKDLAARAPELLYSDTMPALRRILTSLRLV